MNDNFVRLLTYHTDDAVILVAYSGEPCTGKDFGKRNTPKDTVLNYSVGLKKDLLVSELNWNKNLYRRAGSKEKGETADYFNSRDHISINVNIVEEDKEYVASIFYYIPEKYDYLKCKPEVIMSCDNKE